MKTMEHRIEDDQRFLSRSFPLRERPLETSVKGRRILFSPGYGLGLGDQFMCLTLIERLQSSLPLGVIDILTDFPSFWIEQGPLDLNIVGRAREDVEVPASLRDTYDLVLIGYHPGYLDTWAEGVAPTIFCAGTDLASFRCFYSECGEVWEVPLARCNQYVQEEEKFTAILMDVGLISRTQLRLNVLERSVPPQESQLDRGKYKILIHPFSAEVHKEWPLHRWNELIGCLLERNYSVSISSGTHNREMRICEIIKATFSEATVLNQMPLAAFLSKVAQSDMVLSGDTFAIHAVCKMKASMSLAIFGPTDPIRYCPIGLQNYYFDSFNVSSEDILHAMELLLSYKSQNRLPPGFPAELCGRMKDMICAAKRLLTNPGESGFRNALLHAILEVDKAAHFPYRPFLIGSDSHLNFILDTVKKESVFVVLKVFDQWCCARVAALLVRGVSRSLAL